VHEQAFLLASDVHGFFQELISQTLEGRRDRPIPVVESYLVGLLEDSAQGKSSDAMSSVLRGPLSVQLSQALHAPAHERFERLVRLGDGILLLGGLFEPHVQASGMDERYVSLLGARAYSAAAGLMSVDSLPGAEQPLDVLGRLAAEFGRLMALLRDVADTLLARSAKTANDWSRLLEKWLSRRSEHLERLLIAQGITLQQRGGLLV